jgi:carbonic anhydrase/acetyltransferase-like protein (isoleucine patch superfamily)
MKSARWLFRLGPPLLVGISIGLGFGGPEHSSSPNPVAGALANEVSSGLPPVSAGNEWGQHTPRPPVSRGPTAPDAQGDTRGRIRANVLTEFNPDIETPRVHGTAYLDPMSSVIGDVEIGGGVFVAPFVSVRGDEGQPIHIGSDSNLQDGAVVHALETVSQGHPLPENTYLVGGKAYAVYMGERVSLAHQSQVHGPAWIEDDVFVGMQALVFRAHIRDGVVVEPGATIIGVTIPSGRYVPARAIVTTQDVAERLPEITHSYRLRGINETNVRVNRSLASGYSGSAPASHAR